MADGKTVGVSAFLQPGELATAETAMRVKTVVGSCLAIVIRAPRLGRTSIAHCLLPVAGAPVERLAREEALRYVDAAIELMLRSFERWGARSEDLEIKLFGGADSMRRSDPGAGYRVGARNTESALNVLAAHGLGVAALCVGGSRGRAIEVDTGTGDVFVRNLPGLTSRTEDA